MPSEFTKKQVVWNALKGAPEKLLVNILYGSLLLIMTTIIFSTQNKLVLVDSLDWL